MEEQSSPSKRSIRPYGDRKKYEKLPDIPRLEYGKCVGHGFFSHVYKGTFRDKNVAIKIIERGSLDTTMKEIDFLKVLKNTEDVVKLYAAFKTEGMVLVFEYLEGAKKKYLYRHMTAPRLRFILRHVLNALKGAHQLGIVHRDVKLANIMISTKFDKLSLIDWGCANFISTDMSNCAGSRTYRSPEMLLGYRNYGTKGDSWAVGILIIEILAEGKLPWRKSTSKEVLITLTEYFESKEIIDLSKCLNLPISKETYSKMQPRPTKQIESLFTTRMKQFYTQKLKSLLSLLLCIDPEKRITAECAKNEKYFFTKRRKHKKVLTTTQESA